MLFIFLYIIYYTQFPLVELAPTVTIHASEDMLALNKKCFSVLLVRLLVAI